MDNRHMRATLPREREFLGARSMVHILI